MGMGLQREAAAGTDVLRQEEAVEGTRPGLCREAHVKPVSLRMPSVFACATVLANCSHLKTSPPASGCQQRGHRQRVSSRGC